VCWPARLRSSNWSLYDGCEIRLDSGKSTLSGTAPPYPIAPQSVWPPTNALETQEQNGYAQIAGSRFFWRGENECRSGSPMDLH
jgi:hypothetical protein